MNCSVLFLLYVHKEMEFERLSLPDEQIKRIIYTFLQVWAVHILAFPWMKRQGCVTFSPGEGGRKCRRVRTEKQAFILQCVRRVLSLRAIL
jgi:hypothetical protein